MLANRMVTACKLLIKKKRVVIYCENIRLNDLISNASGLGKNENIMMKRHSCECFLYLIIYVDALLY